MFHQQWREGANAEAPTPQALQDWQQNFRQQVQTDTRIGDGQRQRILNRLDNLGDYTPDGPTFYAWQHMNDTARMGAANQNILYSSIAATTGRSYAEVLAEATNIEHQLRAQPERSTRLDPQAVLERARNLGRHSNNYLPQDQTSLAVYSRLLDEADAAAQERANGMQFQEVESSAINRVGYNSANSTLELQFHNGRAYQYQGVPPNIARWLTDPNISAGRLYNRDIRGHFPSQEVTPTPVLAQAPATETAQVEQRLEAAQESTPAQANAATRCPNCGQFVGEGGHNCPAETVLRIDSFQGQNMGEMLETEEGRITWVGWLIRRSIEVEGMYSIRGLNQAANSTTPRWPANSCQGGQHLRQSRLSPPKRQPLPRSQPQPVQCPRAAVIAEGL